jgi:hypothetical protein
VKPESALGRYDPAYLQGIIRILEALRSRLAVAAAADSKITPPGQRKTYLETDQRLRCCLRSLRSLHRLEPSVCLRWSENVPALQRLLASSDEEKGRCHEMCVRLQEVLCRIEAQEGIRNSELPPVR